MILPKCFNTIPAIIISQYGRPKKQGSISGRDKKLFFFLQIVHTGTAMLSGPLSVGSRDTFCRVRRTEHETDHWPLPISEFKIELRYKSIPPYDFNVCTGTNLTLIIPRSY